MKQDKKALRPTVPRGPGILIRVRWPDVAALLGVSVHTAKKLGCGARRKFNPRDLRDLARFAATYRNRRATTV